MKTKKKKQKEKEKRKKKRNKESKENYVPREVFAVHQSSVSAEET